jgi:hypothetical protein
MVVRITLSTHFLCRQKSQSIDIQRIYTQDDWDSVCHRAQLTDQIQQVAYSFYCAEKKKSMNCNFLVGQAS